MSDFETFVERSQQAASVDDLASLFRGAIGREGYENCILTSVRSNAVGHVAWFDFPPGYTDAYIEHRWERIDPVLAGTARAVRPFLWSDVIDQTKLTRQQIAFMNECRELAVHSGIVFPLHGPGNRMDVISISRRIADPPDAGRLRLLHAISVQTWNRYLELSHDSLFQDPGDATLTPREAEVLRWCKHGKSYGEIADILNISRKTVEFHLCNVMNKLKASNKISAIVIAIQRGLIEL